MENSEKILIKKTEENSIENLSFEKGLTQLEEIVNQLERNDIPLEEALDCFQKGIELVKHCNSLLDQAEARIKSLSESGLEKVESIYQNNGEQTANVQKTI
ncbi:MAG: exodeoxyribonuclease VII small subunit [Desulfitobacteriia bacterium]|jgi:exodeoxyribonuclease VII small subunit